MRAFIGIWFPEEKKDQLLAVSKTVVEHSLNGNFTIRDNFHLTLRFIGEVDENGIMRLKKAIDETAVLRKPFSFVIHGYNQFKRQNTSIVYADVNKSKELNDLYRQLEEALYKNGFTKEDRAYTPHITLGREVVLDEDINLKKDKFEDITIDAKDISLIESKQVQGVLRYVPIYTKPLSEKK
jgi:2'-5' RNA ligase